MPNEPSESGRQPDPHHVLNNPATDPDPTEWPDPYEKRTDPRDPAPDDEPFGDESHTSPGATSTSEPHPDQDIEAGQVKPEQRDRVDE
jgi:hypothetical protein